MFPLHRLPISAQIQIFRFFEPLGLIAVSLFSNRVQNIVKLLETPADWYLIFVNQGVIHLQFSLKNHTITFTFKGSISLDTVSSRIEFFMIGEANEHIEWRTPGVNFRKWLSICSIFKYSRHCDLILEGVMETLDLEYLKNAIPEVRNLMIGEGSGEYGQRALELFLLDIKRLRYDFSERPPNFQRLPLQNLDSIYVAVTRQRLYLEDILIFNAKFVELELTFPFPLKDLNRVVKLWIEGEFPRGNYLKIFSSGNEGLDLDVIMKGVTHRILSEDDERSIRIYDREEVIRGGIEIKRRDGRRTTVKILPNRHRLNFYICVWD